MCLCVGDGSIKILDHNYDALHLLKDSQAISHVAEYSPDGALLAVGSSDSNIYVYNVTDDYSLVGVCKEH